MQFNRTDQNPPTSQVDKSDSDGIYGSSGQGGAGSETNSNGQDGTTLSKENDGLSIDASSLIETDDISQESDEDTSIDDLTHSSPIAVSESPDKETVIYYPVLEDFYRIAGIKATELETTLSAKDKAAWGASLEDKIKRLVGTEALPDAKQVNRDREFASKISQANELDRDIKENGEDIAKLRNLIALQEEAYALYAIADLRYGLAQTYLRLAKQYKAINQWDEGYTCCLEAIKYELFYIRILTNCNDSYYICLYELAVRCQWVGDIDILDPDSKIQAFYLSACLFEAASKMYFRQKMRTINPKAIITPEWSTTSCSTSVGKQKTGNPLTIFWMPMAIMKNRWVIPLIANISIRTSPNYVL